MKYTRLTKEQFEALHLEFARFLASQSIDKKEWDEIKQNKPEVAEQELDVFSDLVWEGVLSGAKYLEHFTRDFIFLFYCNEIEVHSIVLKKNQEDIDFLTTQGLQWLNENIFTDSVEIHLGKKKYEEERNAAIFKILQQGAFLSEGKLYKEINAIIDTKE
jgi:hypothetical protein